MPFVEKFGDDRFNVCATSFIILHSFGHKANEVTGTGLRINKPVVEDVVSRLDVT